MSQGPSGMEPPVLLDELALLDELVLAPLPVVVLPEVVELLVLAPLLVVEPPEVVEPLVVAAADDETDVPPPPPEPPAPPAPDGSLPLPHAADASESETSMRAPSRSCFPTDCNAQFIASS